MKQFKILVICFVFQNAILYGQKTMRNLSRNEFTHYDHQKSVNKKDSLALIADKEKIKSKLKELDGYIGANKLSEHLTEFSTPSILSWYISVEHDTLVSELVFSKTQADYGKFAFDLKEVVLEAIHNGHFIYLDKLLKRATKVSYNLDPNTTMQVEPIMQIRMSSGSDRAKYDALLLDYIHKLLKQYKKQLGITDPLIYEHKFEKKHLNVEQQITSRINFINYVSSKI